jgi:hypothetical protein
MKGLGILAGVIAVWGALARAEIEPGDVAVVAYATDGTEDDFAWVALRDIPSNTVLKFTDSSVSNGWFRWSEHLGSVPYAGPLTWSFSNALPAGTVVRFVSDNWDRGLALGRKMDLSVAGDQIFIYTGTIVSNPALAFPLCGDASAADMLFGIDFANGGWNPAGGTTSESAVPAGLSPALRTAVYTDARDNGYYIGPLTGTVNALTRAIANPAHWATSDDPQDEAGWPAGFVVTPTPAGSLFSTR